MMKVRKFLVLFFLQIAIISCAQDGTPCRVILGDERFDEYVPGLVGKRVAVFSNQSGIVGDVVTESGFGPHLVDVLLGKGINISLILSPEHGFRGTADAGEKVSSGIDPGTGVEIVSLYGGKSDLSASLDKFDVLLVDIQDVGLRYYTYYVTMCRLMAVCANGGKKVIILDRPNPNGFYVDGPLLQDGFKSQVGTLPIPIVHGMTWGELAQMINGEGWLEAGKDACKLTVIPCQNYTHQTKTALIRNPSPNLKDMRAVYLYSSTCFFENTLVSVARGTQFPFEAIGSPYLVGQPSYEFSFTPESINATTPSTTRSPPAAAKSTRGSWRERSRAAPPPSIPDFWKTHAEPELWTPP